MTAGRTQGWYFGWNIVAAASVLTLLSVGLRLGTGPFFLPIAADLGFSRSLLATIVAVGMMCYGLAMPLAGQLIARGYSRREEYQADAHGAELLRRIGSSKQVMVDTLQWLLATEGSSSGGFFATHPATADRIEALKSAK